MATHNYPKFVPYGGHNTLNCCNGWYVSSFVIQFPMYTIKNMATNQFYKNAANSWLKAELAWWADEDTNPTQRYEINNVNHIKSFFISPVVARLNYQSTGIKHIQNVLDDLVCNQYCSHFHFF
jgi:hypothetical protein